MRGRLLRCELDVRRGCVVAILVVVAGCGETAPIAAIEGPLILPDGAKLDSGVDSAGLMRSEAGYFPDASCDPGNCPNGCCNGEGFCVDPPTEASCGWHGSLCVSCGSGVCAGALGCQEIRPDCSPSNCRGCCLLNVVFPATGGASSGPVEVCALGTFGAAACGHGGAACTMCAQNEQCRPLVYDAGGYCQLDTSCNSTNCAGCCVGDICAAGTQPEACGYGGSTCNDCGLRGGCVGNTCFTVVGSTPAMDGG